VSEQFRVCVYVFRFSLLILFFCTNLFFLFYFVTDVRAASAAFLFPPYCFIVCELCLCLANRSFIHRPMFMQLQQCRIVNELCASTVANCWVVCSKQIGLFVYFSDQSPVVFRFIC